MQLKSPYDLLGPGGPGWGHLGTPVSRSPRALVTNYGGNNVSWLDLTNPLLPVVLATVTVGTVPYGVAISPG